MIDVDIEVPTIEHRQIKKKTKRSMNKWAP